MNIFDETTGLFGEYKKGEQKQLSNNFWNTAREIRQELSEDAYILDAYLSEIFTALDSELISNIVDEAENMTNKIYFLCKNIVEYEPIKNKDNFYEVSYNYIVSHPLPYKENKTRFNMYVALLIDDFTDMFIEKTYNEINSNSFSEYNFDIIKDYFKKISEKVGHEKIETLNNIIKKRFALPTIIDIFKRTVSRHLFFYLLKRDNQTSKHIFQLLLER